MVLALYPVLLVYLLMEHHTSVRQEKESLEVEPSLRVLRVHVQTFKLSIDESQISEGRDK